MIRLQAGAGADTVYLDDLSGRLHARVWQLEHALAAARSSLLQSPLGYTTWNRAQHALDRLRNLAAAAAEGSRQYAHREQFLRGVAEQASATLMWNVGRIMPVLLATYGPALVGGVAIIFALAAARRLVPGSPFDRVMNVFESTLPDSGQFLSNPAVVQSTALLVSGADDFVAGFVGLPQPPSGGPLSGEDAVAAGIITSAAAVGIRAFQESSVRVRNIEVSNDSSPHNYEELVSRIPRAEEGAAQIRIEKYDSGYVVYLGGTIDAGIEPAGEPWDMTSNMAAIAEMDSGSYTATIAAMREAGIRAEDNVIMVGHSQGGLVAAQIAASGEYRVSDVVTVGAPLHQVELPEDVHLVAIEHSEDVIPSLSGVAVPATVATHLTVQRSLYHSAPPPRGEVLPAHNLSRYIETAGVMDSSGESKLTAEQRRISARTQGNCTTTLWRADRV